MPNEIRYLLSKETSSFHDRVSDWARRRMTHSQNFMSQRYPQANENEHLYRSFRDPDATDLEVSAGALTQGTRKIVVPITYAQIQSIVAWQLGFFTERKPPIPVEGLGPRDVHPAILHEHLLEYQLDGMYPKGLLCTFQWFLDGFIYGLGVMMNAWVVREYLGYVRKAMPLGFNGTAIGMDDDLVEEDVVSYEGNQAINVSLFDFFPDPRVPIGRFQEGSFCAYRTRRSRQENRIKAKEGMYEGVEFISVLREDQVRGMSLGGSWNDSDLSSTMGLDSEGGASYLDEYGKPFDNLHHLYAYVPPNVLRLRDERELMYDSGGLPRMWTITLANLDRVIRVEPANLPVRKFPFAIWEPNYNVHSMMNPGLVEVMSGPQYHASWLVNSRVTNVRRSMNYELVYDPGLIEENDLRDTNVSGLIRLKPEAYHEEFPSLDRIVKQMPVTDVTAGHMADFRMWVDMMEQTSGGNRMIQGLSNTGRRAATEVQASMSLAANRMKLYAFLAAAGLGDLAMQMIENTKAFLEQRLQIRLRDPYNALLGQDFIMITPDLLQGQFRIPFLEQGIPTDKTFKANALKELLGLMFQDPTGAAQQRIIMSSNPMEVYFDYLRTLGIKNIKDYMDPRGAQMAMQLQQAQQSQQMQMAMQPAQISAQPDEHVAREVEKGNLIPDEGGGGMPSPMSLPGVGSQAGMF